MSDEHFCTCTDLECPFNPNGPGCRHRTCDRCIRKCLKAGEIPSCFFKAVHEDTSGNADWTYRGFVAWMAEHGSPDSSVATMSCSACVSACATGR